MQVLEQRIGKYEARLLDLPDIKNVRIAKNHAQMMALVEALKPIAGLSDDQVKETILELQQMAVARQQAIGADHPMVASFWESYDYLNWASFKSDDGITEQKQVLNHSKNPQEIAVNLNRFVEIAADRRQQIPLMNDLKKHLRGSRSRKFIDYKAVSSAITGSSVKCWVFENNQ